MLIVKGRGCMFALLARCEHGTRHIPEEYNTGLGVKSLPFQIQQTMTLDVNGTACVSKSNSGKTCEPIGGPTAP